MVSYQFHFCDDLPFEVHQCLMALPDVGLSEIQCVTTHPQALAQCRESLLVYNPPQAQLVEWEDTAKAACDLAEGRLSAGTAVIASARAAEVYGLDLLVENIEDSRPNITTFIIVTAAG